MVYKTSNAQVNRMCAQVGTELVESQWVVLTELGSIMLTSKSQGIMCMDATGQLQLQWRCSILSGPGYILGYLSSKCNRIRSSQATQEQGSKEAQYTWALTAAN